MKKVIIRCLVKIRYFLQTTFCLLVFFSCSEPKTFNGYSKKNNFYYKLLSIGDGKIKPDTSETLWIDVKCLTLKDSVFWDTKHEAFQRFFIKQNSFSFARQIFTWSEGDSVQYLIPSSIFFKEFFKLPVPFFSEKDSVVKFSVKIMRILNTDELAHINDSLTAVSLQQQNEEYAQINNYVTLNFKGSLQFSPDAFMQITQTTKGDSVKKGCKLCLLYKGFYLDGRLADFTPDNRPFEFTVGHEGQIIEGLRLALYHLKKGEKAKIILPSRLAFGSRGSSNGSIAPYTPLLYEVEIADVKK
jgi:FKBP-type peptidyl-prolyl cis-trans isomerase FkpA